MNIPDNAAADAAVQFISRLTHTKGRWSRQPFQLHPWQEQAIRQIFGTLRPDGLRQYRTVYFSTPRKNGKTELGSAIAAKLLIGEPEQGGEGYSAACSREQASLVFRPLAQMIRNDAELSRVCTITESSRKIVYERTNSVYRAIPADAPSQHGYNASFVVADELHAWPGRDLWDVLTTSSGSREQPLTIVLTTAGHDRKSLCHELYQYACKVRDGIIDDPTFLPIIYEAPEGADWADEEVWRVANPALASGFRSLEEMRQVFREARENPARETVFKQLYLNQWVESVSRWISSDTWTASAGTVDPDELRGRECTAGLDLAYRSDFCALVLCFNVDGVYKLVPYFWLPRDGARDLRAPHIARWIAQGHIELTGGGSTNYDTIRARINALGQQFHIRELACDRWNAHQLMGQLQEDGFEVIEFPQTLKMFNEPTKSFEALVKAKRLHHGNHPVLTWMLSNVAIEQDGSGNYRPSKKKSTEKIDGVVSAIMALHSNMNAPPPQTSVYETRGLLYI